MSTAPLVLWISLVWHWSQAFIWLFDLSWPAPRLSFGSVAQFDLCWKYLMRNWKVEKAANLEWFFVCFWLCNRFTCYRLLSIFRYRSHVLDLISWQLSLELRYCLNYLKSCIVVWSLLFLPVTASSLVSFLFLFLCQGYLLLGVKTCKWSVCLNCTG